MAKLKGILRFKLDGNEKFDVFGESLPEGDAQEVKVVSVLRDENGLPNLQEHVEWDATAKRDNHDPSILKISGKPQKKSTNGRIGNDDWTGDLIGDLTVTVQWPSGPIHSFSISRVVYRP